MKEHDETDHLLSTKANKERLLEDVFNDEKRQGVKDLIDKHTLEEVAERLKGKELFKESNDRARKILSEIKSLPIQETLEEASWKFNPLKKLDGEFLRHAFKEGAKWQQEQDKNVYLDAYVDGSRAQAKLMYSEEDMEEAFTNGLNRSFDSDFDRWFEQFKKK